MIAKCVVAKCDVSRINVTENCYSEIIFGFLDTINAKSVVKYSDYIITSRAIVDA